MLLYSKQSKSVLFSLTKILLLLSIPLHVLQTYKKGMKKSLRLACRTGGLFCGSKRKVRVFILRFIFPSRFAFVGSRFAQTCNNPAKNKPPVLQASLR